MRIEGTTYELVASSTTSTKGIFGLVEDIEERAELSILATEGLNQIAEDFIRENVEFDTWGAAIKEIEIRGVGYAVETTMRTMFETNKAKDAVYKVALESLSEWRRNLDDLIQSGVGETDPDIVEIQQQIEKLQQEANELDKNILRWNETTYLKYSYRDRQLVQWLLGERTEEPKLLNCWECVLFAFVRTAPGNVTKEYINWAIDTVSTPVFIDFDPNKPGSYVLPRFYSRCSAIMDYYLPRHGTPVVDAAKERFRPSDDRLRRFELPPPEKFVIPRGRMLIFDDVAHVAISTGKPFPIETPYAKELFPGRKKGHGVLDLNVKEHTIRERTIEELISPDAPACNSRLMVAPFPICTESGTIESSQMLPPTEEEKWEYIKSIDELAGKIYDRAVKRHTETRDRALKAGKASTLGIENRYLTALRIEKEKVERAALKARQEFDETIQSIDQIAPDPRKDSVVFKYGPADAYGGKVTF